MWDAPNPTHWGHRSMGSPSWEHLLTGFFKIPLRFCGAVHPFSISTLNRIRDPLTLFPQLLFGIFWDYLGFLGMFWDSLASPPLSRATPPPLPYLCYWSIGSRSWENHHRLQFQLNFIFCIHFFMCMFHDSLLLPPSVWEGPQKWRQGGASKSK